MFSKNVISRKVLVGKVDCIAKGTIITLFKIVFGLAVVVSFFTFVT
jgi:hypothetical protein